MIRGAFVLEAILTVVVLTLVTPLQGQPAKKIALGDASPAFTDLPGVDGKKHSLSEFKKDVVVVVVTCNNCPVAAAYEGRIKAFAGKNKDKVDVIAVNVTDGVAKMTERAKEAGFTFTYLYDESQQFAQALGAEYTPHFFVLDKNRKLVYRGAMDDNNVVGGVTKNYLEAAVTSVLGGEAPATAETHARGCAVRYKTK